jgi:hypothetical protein
MAGELGAMFGFILILPLIIILTLCLFQVFKMGVRECKIENKSLLLEELYLNRLGVRRGYDLDKELLKERILAKTGRQLLRDKIFEEIKEDMFPKSKEVINKR